MKSLDAAIVTMRNSSKRLPNKSMAKITAKLTAADIIIQRAKLTGLPVILATSTDQSDDSLEVIGKNQNISVFRGSLHNKIKRWYDCFTEYNLENALLIDGDDLCYDFEIGQRALSELKVVKPAYGCVNPHMVITGTLYIDAICPLAESIDIIRSRLEISEISFSSPFKKSHE